MADDVADDVVLIRPVSDFDATREIDESGSHRPEVAQRGVRPVAAPVTVADKADVGADVALDEPLIRMRAMVQVVVVAGDAAASLTVGAEIVADEGGVAALVALDAREIAVENVVLDEFARDGVEQVDAAVVGAGCDDADEGTVARLGTEAVIAQHVVAAAAPREDVAHVGLVALERPHEAAGRTTNVGHAEVAQTDVVVNCRDLSSDGRVCEIKWEWRPHCQRSS